MTKIPRLKVLTKPEVSTIYDKVLHFLEKKGVRVDHPQALKILAKAGAQVDFNTSQVKFPKDIVEAALRSVPHKIRLAGRGKHQNGIVPHPNGLFYTWSSTGCRYYVEPVTNIYRNVMLDDVANWGQLIEALDNIDHASFLTPTDMPEQTADIHSMKTMLENTSKHITVQPHSLQSVAYHIELAQAVASVPLKKRPIMHIFCGSVAPFIFKPMDMEIIIQSCRHEIPVEIQSLTCMGATSPITIAGSLILGNIELMAQLVMTQLFNPGNPVMCTAAACSTLDMLTGMSMTEGVESLMAIPAGIQVAKEVFHTPVSSAGFLSDSYIPDGQAMMSAALKGLLASSAGNDVLGVAGRLCSGKSISNIQLILDDTVASILKRILGGVKIDEDTMAFQEIMDTQPGGHFLQLTPTLKHCRDAMRPDLFVSKPYETWVAEGSKDLTARAEEKYRELKKKMNPLELPKEVQNELNRIAKHADEHLVK